MNNGPIKTNQLVARTLMATLGLFIAVQIFSHSTFAQDLNKNQIQNQNRQPGTHAPVNVLPAGTPPTAAPATAAPAGPASATPPGAPTYDGQQLDRQADDRQSFDRYPSGHHRFMYRFMAPFMPPVDDSNTADGDMHRHHGGGGLFGFPHFRHFVNRQVSYLPAFLLLLVTSCLLWTLIPDKMAAGVTCTREQFWKSLVLGLSMGVTLPVIHCFFFSGIGMPLAHLLLGLLQLGLVSGFAVVASVIGAAIINRYNGTKFFENHPLELRYLSLLIGVAVISLLFLIPSIGIFSGLGNRLVLLNAALGLGSLINARISNRKTT